MNTIHSSEKKPTRDRDIDREVTLEKEVGVIFSALLRSGREVEDIVVEFEQASFDNLRVRYSFLLDSSPERKK